MTKKKLCKPGDVAELLAEKMAAYFIVMLP